MSTAKTVGCRVCASMEPRTVNRLLALGRGPRWIAAAGLGVGRRAVAQHRDSCLTDPERENVARELLAAVGRGEGPS